MNLHRRLSKLEQAIADLGIAVSYCQRCHAPQPGFDLTVLITDAHGNPLYDRCPECGRMVDAKGVARWARPLPRSGTVHIKRIILPRRPVHL